MSNPAQTPTEAIRLDDLYEVKKFAHEAPFLSVPALRWQLRNRGKNGLSGCVVIVGKKLLISKSRYEQWLGNQAGRAA